MQTITFLCFVLLRKCCRYQALQTNITDIDIQYISMISQKRCWSEKNKVTTVHCLHQTHTSIYLCWPITSLEIARNLMSLKNWSIPLHISPVVCRLHLPSVIIDLLPAEGILVFHITSSDYVPTQQKSTQCQCAASYYQGWDLYHIQAAIRWLHELSSYNFLQVKCKGHKKWCVFSLDYRKETLHPSSSYHFSILTILTLMTVISKLPSNLQPQQLCNSLSRAICESVSAKPAVLLADYIVQKNYIKISTKTVDQPSPSWVTMHLWGWDFGSLGCYHINCL